MGITPSGLGYGLVAVILGFACIIYLSLRFRKSSQTADLNMTPEQVWEIASRRPECSGFSETEMLFGIFQDASFVLAMQVVKNFKGEEVARIEYPMAERRLDIWVGDQRFEVEFPATWRRTARLVSAENKSVLATYEELGAFGRHQFSIPGYGNLVSKRSSFRFSPIYSYFFAEKKTGVVLAISARRAVGKILMMPTDLPLHLRVFMMAL